MQLMGQTIDSAEKTQLWESILWLPKYMSGAQKPHTTWEFLLLGTYALYSGTHGSSDQTGEHLSKEHIFNVS